MTGQEIREQHILCRIAHHYFYQPGRTMVRFPLLRFDKERYPENYAKLQAVVAAEKAAGRFDKWETETPEPFPHLKELLFPGYD